MDAHWDCASAATSDRAAASSPPSISSTGSKRRPAPVAPGATLELDVDFTARLPTVVERTGYRSELLADETIEAYQQNTRTASKPSDFHCSSRCGTSG